MGAFGGGHELSADRKGGDRFLAPGEQAGDALAERQVRAGTFDRGHENGCGVVREHDMRAGAGQRPPDAGAESAQAFQARSGGETSSRRSVQSGQPPARRARTGASRSLRRLPRKRLRRWRSPTRCGCHPDATAKPATRSSPAARADRHAEGTVGTRARSFCGRTFHSAANASTSLNGVPSNVAVIGRPCQVPAAHCSKQG